MEKRNEIYDIAKGIGIILVVIGHTGIPDYFSNWIYSFHMPLFFWISGTFYKPEKNTNLLILLQRKFNSLIKPYIIFTIIILFLTHAINNNNNLFDYFIINFKYGWSGLALWFIPVLFITEVIYYLLNKYINKYIIYSLLICIALAYLLSTYKIHLPYKLEVVCTSIVFYSLGYLLNNKIKFPWYYLLYFLFINILFTSLNSEKLDLAYNKLGMVIPTYIAAISGILSIVLFSEYYIKLKKNIWSSKILIFLGKNTFIILAFHQIIMMLIISLTSSRMSIVRHLIMWGILFLLIYIINNYFGWILSKSSSKTTIN